MIYDFIIANQGRKCNALPRYYFVEQKKSADPTPRINGFFCVSSLSIAKSFTALQHGVYRQLFLLLHFLRHVGFRFLLHGVQHGQNLLDLLFGVFHLLLCLLDMV